jgi:flagellar hook-associated protein 3 FlgL
VTGRVTEGMMSRRLLTELNYSTSRIATTQRQLASGKRLEVPSDDPLATHTSLRLRGELEAIAQDQRTIGDATGWLDTTEGSLQQITELVHRARELTVQAGNGSLNQADLDKIANEIDQLTETAKSAANASYGGRYVLSGTLTDTPPYLAGAVDAYQGDVGTIARQIGPGVAVQVNTLGSDVLGSGGADGRFLSTLRTIATDLRAGNTNALRTTALTALEANLEDVTSARGVVGALTNRLEAAAERLGQVEVSATALLSETEDTDVAQALIDLTTQQSVYQAALRSGSALIQPSLLDFLR